MHGLGLVRSVRRRALDFIRPRHSCDVAACRDRDTARRDRTQPPVNLPLATLPRRQCRLCSDPSASRAIQPARGSDHPNFRCHGYLAQMVAATLAEDTVAFQECDDLGRLSRVIA